MFKIGDRVVWTQKFIDRWENDDHSVPLRLKGKIMTIESVIRGIYTIKEDTGNYSGQYWRKADVLPDDLFEL